MDILTRYGANRHVFEQAALYPGLSLGRVVLQYKGLYGIVTEQSESTGGLLAEVSGKFRHEAACLSDYPAVGDFVMAGHAGGDAGNAVIHHVLGRSGVFERPAVGVRNQMQVVAANIDIAFICMALNNDYNPSRLERYLAVAWNGRVMPVVVLTKSDLCDDLPAVMDEIASIAVGVGVITTSNREPGSRDKLLPYLKTGVTASFIGSSGVGKSTLINLLAGEALLATSEIRQDGRGRHTTTRRELLLLPQGGIVVDTPGMRELGADFADTSAAFADIETLAECCRFNDCTHTGEPGCAVRRALESGALDERRLSNYRKLRREAKYSGLSSRQIETEKLNSMFKDAGGMKKAREHIRRTDKRR